jgi:GTP cyclohydrolase I
MAMQLTDSIPQANLRGRVLRAKPPAGSLEPEEIIATNIRQVIALLGENPDREGLLKTPKRFAKAFQFLTSGYRADIDKIVNGALFTEESDEIVLIRDIEMFSTCEHHLLPFYGKVHVAYLPDGKIIGLSKIPRIVNAFARRFQVQERLTQQIAKELVRVLKPRGVAVIIEAHHMCMMMRGVEKQHAFATTASMQGCFKTDREARRDLHALLGLKRRSSGRIHP